MVPILGQQKNADGPPDEVIVALIVGVCGVYLVLLIVFIFFLLTLQKALARCRPRNRTMEPGHVWLNLIPLFHIVWMFITVSRISESLRYEFDDRGWGRRGEDYGNGLGIATCALALASNIPYLGCVIALAWVVCFIMYWVKIAGYGSQLSARGYAADDDYDDDRADEWDDTEDDRRRGRKDRDEDDRDDDRERRPWDRGGR